MHFPWLAVEGSLSGVRGNLDTTGWVQLPQPDFHAPVMKETYRGTHGSESSTVHGE
jgi:hypothetical protein